MKLMTLLGLLIAALGVSLVVNIPAQAAPISSPYGPNVVTSEVDSGPAPSIYQFDNRAWVTFMQEPMDECGYPEDKNLRILGCYFSKKGAVYLPNPCTDPRYAGEKFASLVCHELGHINGWPGDHPRARKAP